MIKKLYENLMKLRLSNGLYIASTGDFYRQFCWLRDCFYESLPSLYFDPDLYIQTYHTILDYLKKLELEYRKFSSMIENPTDETWRHLHARVDAKTSWEIHSYWRNKQDDICGELLYGIFLGENAGLNIIRDSEDVKIINLLIKYMEAIEYWHHSDSGYWEEDESRGGRSSSIGICVSGLTAMKKLNRNDIFIPEHLIMKGKITLTQLLPKETKDRDVDMALLSLIWPFNVVNTKQRDEILFNVESRLLRDYGCIRYIGDQYYNADYSNPLGNEAQWTLGDLYFANIYIDMGDFKKGEYHLNRVLKNCTDGNIPELYINGVANCNSILGWANALAVLAMRRYY
jgi:hypothetical protein